MATTVNSYFLIKPNWEQGMTLKKRWMTNRQISINNTKKKSGIFSWPRRILLFDVLATSYIQAAYIKRKINKNLSNIWGIPFWMDETILTAQASAAQKILQVAETDYRNFEVGAECIIYGGQDAYEIGTIDTITSTQITLVDNLTINWNSGVSVYPILKARISKTQDFEYITDQHSLVSIEAVETFDTITRHTPVITGYPTFSDLPIFDTPPDWSQPMTESQIRNYRVLEYYGQSISWDQWDYSDLKWQTTYYLNSKADIQKLVDFFDYNKGRWGKFWRPSWFTDIKLTESVSAGVNILPIEDIDFDLYWKDNPASDYLYISWPNGDYQIMKVWYTDDDGNLVMTSNLDHDIDLGSNVLVSFLSRCEFHQDEVAISYLNDGKATINFNFNTIFHIVSPEPIPVDWLDDWAYRYKITIDNTNIDSDQTHLPVAIHLGDSVGKDDQDMSQFFELMDVTGDSFTGTNGDNPNSEIWYLNEPNVNSTLEIQNNKLAVNCISASGAAWLSIDSIFQIPDESEIQVDFSDLVTDATAPSDGIELQLKGSGSIKAYIKAKTGNFEYYVNNGGSSGSLSRSRSNDYGSLRLTRSAGKVTCSYKDGTDSWYSFAAFNFTTADCDAIMGAYTVGGKSAITGNFDNFVINSGIAVWSGGFPFAKRIAITKDDGTSQLFGEIENFDNINQKALIWVSRSDLEVYRDETLDLYLYFDNTKSDNTDYIGDASDKNTITYTGDDFTGSDNDSPDPIMWIKNVDTWQDNHLMGGDCFIKDNLLRMEVFEDPTGYDHAVLASNFFLSGDFDIQISCEEIDWDLNPTDDRALFLYYWIDNETRGFVRFRQDSAGKGFTCRNMPSGTWSTDISTSRTNDYGGLRLIRSGTTITCQYKDGTGSWTTLSTFTFNNEDLFLIFVFRNDGEPTYVNVDDFVINSGTVKMMPSKNVWNPNDRGIYTFAQDPNGDVANSIKDSSSYGYHGTPAGSMTSADLVNGLGSGLALDFDGTNDVITSPWPQNVMQNAITDKITFKVLIHSDDWSTLSRTEKPLSNTQSSGISIGLSTSGEIEGSVYAGGSYRKRSFDFTSLTAGFHLFCWTADGSELKMFVDGVQQGSALGYSGSITYNATVPLCFGAEPDASGPASEWWIGKIGFAAIAWGATTGDEEKAFWHSIQDNLLTFGVLESNS